MSIILLGKLMVGGILAAGSALCIYVVTQRLLDKEISVYGLTTTVASNASTEAAKAGADKNYRCKLEGENSPLFECEVKEIEITGKKKHISITKHVAIEATAEAIEANKLTAADSVFHIITCRSNLKGWNATESSKKALEVVRVNKNGEQETETSQYAKMNILFTVDEEGHFEGKRKYFVGKSSSNISATIKSYKCSWASYEEAAKETSENCKIYGLVSGESADSETSFSELTFQGSLSVTSTQVVASKYYVVDFEELSIHESTEKIIFFAEGNADTAKQTTFTNIHTASFAKDSLLILGEYK